MKDWNSVISFSQNLDAFNRQRSNLPSCPDCCRVIDKDYGSMSLNNMLFTIYGKPLIKRIRPPSCLPCETPKESDNYKDIIPSELPENPLDKDIDYNVNSIDISNFKYKQLNNLQHFLMTCPASSFLSRFTGLGQVMLPSS